MAWPWKWTSAVLRGRGLGASLCLVELFLSFFDVVCLYVFFIHLKNYNT